jgi:ligand-binding sensor domain-containing protein/signal transduction histidine kinase
MGAVTSTAEPDFLLRMWSAHDGLPSANILAVQRTPEGYLWVGTRDGLARFDGVRFRVFTPENTPALQTNVVRSLLTDRRGDLWIGMENGLVRRQDGKFAAVNTGPAVAGAAITELAEDRSGAVWALAADRGLLRINPERCEILTNGLPALSGVQRLIADAAGEIWVVTQETLFTFREGRWMTYGHPQPRFSNFSALAHALDGDLWVAGGRRVEKLKDRLLVAGPRISADSRDAPQSLITALFEDRSGRLWAGTHGGGLFCRPPDADWQRITAKRARSQGSVSCIREDNEGSIWAGTTAGILWQVKPRLVTTWSLPLAARECMPQTVCVARDGTVWVGTDGAGVFQHRQGVFTRAGTGDILNATVVSIYEDSRTNLWFGTLNGLFRREGDQLARVSDPLLAGRLVSALFEDRDGTLWAGTGGAVIRKHGDEAELFRLPAGARQFEVRAIAQDSAGTIWLGARGGGLFRFVQGQLEKVRDFMRPAIVSIHCDADDALWIGTHNSGLYRYKEGATDHWMMADGLPGNTLYAILEDTSGTLWMSSNEGIFGVSKSALMDYLPGRNAPLLPTHLAVGDERLDNLCSGSGQPAAAKTPDGRFWFPTARGVVFFAPAGLPQDHQPAAVLVDEVWMDGVAQPVEGTDSLRVRSGIRRIEFHFTSPQLQSPARLKFRYRLDGLEDEWVDAGAQRVAHYSHLPPGQYEFHVMAGLGGTWKQAEQPLRLQVVPRLWQTRWFQVTSVLALLAAAAAAARYVERAKLRRKLQRLEMHQTMERERRRIAQDLHDDLGSGITEIMLLGELAERDDVSLAEAQTQVATMTEKTRQLARAMDEIVWTVNPRNDALPHLGSYLCDYAREYFRAMPARCRIDFASRLPAIPLTAQVRHNLFLAFKEALTNAARHSGAREVWLRIHYAQGRFVVSVEDDGKGFDPSGVADDAGNGLDNMRARLESIGGQTEVSSQPGRGTSVRFTLPVSDA